MFRKISITILCTAWTGSALPQSGITWQPPVAVGSPNYNNQHPRLALDGSDNPMIIWGDAPANKAWFARWNGTSFTAPQQLNPGSIPVFAASWAGPGIASSGDTVYVVFKKTPESVDTNHIFLRRSFDGGQTFTMPAQVDFIADSISRFPAAGVASDGQPIIGFMKFDPGFGNARWAVTRSSDYGITFAPDVPASGFSGGDVCDCCPAVMIPSGNTMGIVYRDNLNNLRNMWAGISTDNGMTFPGGIQIDKTNWMISSCPASGPDGVIIGDTLYAVFMSGAGGSMRVYWSKSSVSGMQYTSGAVMAGSTPGLSVQNYPRIAHSGTAAAIVWVQTVSGQNQLPLLFTTDIHSGISNSYDTVAAGNAGSILNADVTVSSNAVHVVWEDNLTGNLWYRQGTFSTTATLHPVSGHEFSLFPNPVTGETLYLEINSPAAIEIPWNISDLSGRELINGTDIPDDHHLNIPVNSLANGTYLVGIIMNGSKVFKKFVVSDL